VTLNLRDGGITNIHEEVWRLGCKWGVIGKPNAMTYTYKDKKWVGKPSILAALASSPAMQAEIAAELQRLDNIPGAVKDVSAEEVEKQLSAAE